MNQEGLNFNIINTIQDKLTSHIAALGTIGQLIGAASDNDEIIGEHIGFGLSSFINQWIQTHNTIIKEL